MEEGAREIKLANINNRVNCRCLILIVEQPRPYRLVDAS